MTDIEQGFAANGAARLFYRSAGRGTPLVMLHAGVADHRQWNEQFEHFARDYRVMRSDQRGFGRSAPVAGRYRAIDDLAAVMSTLGSPEPAVLMGCSMGGSLAMDYTIAHPDRVAALVMVCSGPSGLKLDVPGPSKFADVERADAQGNLDLVCELETQIWFDGESREPSDVDPRLRALAYEMNRQALEHDAKGLGERERDLEPAAHKRLGEIQSPVLVITGELDIPYMAAAADFMCEHIQDVRRIDVPGAAHLPSMERAGVVNDAVEAFLAECLGPS